MPGWRRFKHASNFCSDTALLSVKIQLLRDLFVGIMSMHRGNFPTTFSHKFLSFGLPARKNFYVLQGVIRRYRALLGVTKKLGRKAGNAGGEMTKEK
jgi:hypothetical protein